MEFVSERREKLPGAKDYNILTLEHWAVILTLSGSQMLYRGNIWHPLTKLPSHFTTRGAFSQMKTSTKHQCQLHY